MLQFECTWSGPRRSIRIISRRHNSAAVQSEVLAAPILRFAAVVALCSRCSKTVPAEEDRTRRMRAGVCSCIIPGPMIGCQSQASEVSDQILGRMRSHSAQSDLLTRLPAIGSSPSARLLVCRSSQAIFSPRKAGQRQYFVDMRTESRSVRWRDNHDGCHLKDREMLAGRKNSHTTGYCKSVAGGSHRQSSGEGATVLPPSWHGPRVSARV